MEYPAGFLAWWGLLGFLCRLGSLRQWDFELRGGGPCVLQNVNGLAGTQLETLPVRRTLSHFMDHVGAAGFAGLQRQLNAALIRGKALDGARLRGHFVVALDGTGLFSFAKRHCGHCLTQTHGGRTLYYHHVLDAKLVAFGNLALSLGNEFIDNAERAPEGAGAPPRTAAQQKQDCELKAWGRLAPALKRAYPRTPLCLSGDSLYACGAFMESCRQHRWAFLAVFKPGDLPVLWAEFQAHLGLCPEKALTVLLPGGTRREYRWANNLVHVDAEKRPHRVDAIQLTETRPGEKPVTFAWLTSFRVGAANVAATAQQGGRERQTIENSFNIQKNGGHDLEHAYGRSRERMRSFYILLQIAHTIAQLVEQGSLLRRAVAGLGKSVAAVYGSLRNIARRLLECLRFGAIPAGDFQERPPLQVRLDSS